MTVLSLIFFRGKPLDLHDGNRHVTSCIFDVWLPWLFQMGGIVDVINCLLFLFLFLYPMYNAYSTSIKSLPSIKKRAFISAMKYNIVCSVICTITSFCVMFLMPYIPQHIWLAGNIDMMVNSVCVFIMLASNRKYLLIKFCCCISYYKNKNLKSISNEKTKTNMTTSIQKLHSTSTPVPDSTTITTTTSTTNNNNNNNSLNVESAIELNSLSSKENSSNIALTPTASTINKNNNDDDDYNFDDLDDDFLIELESIARDFEDYNE